MPKLSPRHESEHRVPSLCTKVSETLGKQNQQSKWGLVRGQMKMVFLLMGVRKRLLIPLLPLI